MKKYFFYFLLPILLLATACEGTEEPITLQTDNLTFSALGGDLTLTFTSPGQWEAHVNTDGAGWLFVNPLAAGAGGENTLTVSAGVNNSENKRSAMISISSGQQLRTVAVTQLGMDEDPVQPIPDGKRIKQINISKGGSSTIISYAFKYDTQGRIWKIIYKSIYEGFTEYTETHTAKYIDNRVLLTTKDSEGSKSELTVLLNAEKYAEQMSFKMSGNPTVDTELYYDNNERLVTEEITEAGNTYLKKHIWTDDNRCGIVYENDSIGFRYSTYENNSNFDINWVISSYPSVNMAVIPGILGLLGKRCVNYTYPGNSKQEYIPDLTYPLPLPEDFQHNIQFSTRYNAVEEQKTEYAFNENGTLDFIKSELPYYMIHYDVSISVRVLNYDNYTLINDIKYYYDVEFKSEKKEIKREFKGNDYTFVKIEY